MAFHAPAPTWPHGAAAAVSPSFDDARDSQLDRAIPLLDAHGLRATFYVMPDPLRRRAPQWAAAARPGHELGNHTATHPCSGNYRWEHDPAEDRTLADMELELDLCDAAIEEVCGHRPTTFAYPCSRTHVGRGASNGSSVPPIARRYVIGRLYGDVFEALCARLAVDERVWVATTAAVGKLIAESREAL